MDLNRPYIWAIFIYSLIVNTSSLPEQGIYDTNLTDIYGTTVFARTLYKKAQVFVNIDCSAPNGPSSVDIKFIIMQSGCWDSTDTMEIVQRMLNTPVYQQQQENISTEYQFSKTYACNDHIALKPTDLTNNNNKEEDKSLHPSKTPLHVINRDGVYVLGFSEQNNSTGVSVLVRFDIRNEYGYLTAADWALLPFYGFMCIFYVLLGLIWLLLSFLQWRDLLRVQFWIGAVIFLGMLEKATFYAEYQSINNTGMRVQGAVLFAEWVSCAKRTLARMLVIIVSLGFGIVKPRLGSTLHRVVGCGLLYFFLAAFEAYLRIIKSKNNNTRDLLVAQVPLAVLDSAICWWIFSALVNTTRTLRLRRNETKLALYRHFTNTLIFSVVSSIFFMLYIIKAHRYIKCIRGWKDMWIEDAFWHILFSVQLLVIMILWRPTNNNQRYAFVPLLDTGDDEEEEEERLVSDAYGVKVRIHHHHQKQPNQGRNSVEEDLKWLEENVKSEAALPILDSDEEMVNTRFEVSKMQ